MQLCIAHMVRNSRKFVSYEDLKKIYTAVTEQAGRDALDDFGKRWDSKYPMNYKSWDDRWKDLCEFYNYPEEIRRAVYTANTIEPLNFQLRKVTRNRLTFVNDDAIYKIMYLAVRNACEKSTMRNWGMALHQFGACNKFCVISPWTFWLFPFINLLFLVTPYNTMNYGVSEICESV